jgi:hypothetical protein
MTPLSLGSLRGKFYMTVRLGEDILLGVSLLNMCDKPSEEQKESSGNESKSE